MLRNLYLGLILMFSLEYSVVKASEYIPNGKCAIIVASRSNINDVRDFTDAVKNQYDARVFQTRNGWYAIAAGYIRKGKVQKTLSKLKRNGVIPHDSFCSNGDRFVREIASNELNSQEADDPVFYTTQQPKPTYEPARRIRNTTDRIAGDILKRMNEAKRRNTTGSRVMLIMAACSNSKEYLKCLDRMDKILPH